MSIEACVAPDFEHVRARIFRILAAAICCWVLSACQSIAPTLKGASIDANAKRDAPPESLLPLEQAPSPASRMPNDRDIAAPLPASSELWQRLRAGMAIPAPGGRAGARLLVHERWYQANQTYLQRTFKRARLYLFDIVEAVERENMPMELALLPAVESAFMPTARSSAAADGLWQFIAPTGRRFNLQQHMFQDDRRNVRSATQAALRYLKELQVRYKGDYQLALAAYNCGEGCIDAAIWRARAKGMSGRFEDLTLVEETANYVPRLLALSQLLARAVDAGSTLSAGFPPMGNRPYYAAVPIRRDIDIKLAAELAGLRLEEFKALNAQHKKPVIVAAANAEVLVPVEHETQFIESLARHRGPTASWATAKVGRRASVEALSRQHVAAPATLREVNSIPFGHWVAAGSTLLVPRKATDHDISALVAETSTLATHPSMVLTRVPLRRKETWPLLAARLGVTAEQLRAWNPRHQSLLGRSVPLALPLDLADRVAQRPFALATRSVATRPADKAQSRNAAVQALPSRDLPARRLRC